MFRRVLLSGLCGGVVTILFMIVVNGLLGFQARIDMNRLTNEPEVYEVLKKNVTEAGRYAVNPQLTASGRFPDGEPVFSVMYGGVGHEAAGSQALVQLPIFFLLPLLASWLLAHADRDLLASYPRKLVFYATVGLMIAIASRLTHFGIGGYPAHDAVALALFELVTWIAAGVVMAAIVKPVKVPLT